MSGFNGQSNIPRCHTQPTSVSSPFHLNSPPPQSNYCSESVSLPISSPILPSYWYPHNAHRAPSIPVPTPPTGANVVLPAVKYEENDNVGDPTLISYMPSPRQHDLYTPIPMAQGFCGIARPIPRCFEEEHGGLNFMHSGVKGDPIAIPPSGWLNVQHQMHRGNTHRFDNGQLPFPHPNVHVVGGPLQVGQPMLQPSPGLPPSMAPQPFPFMYSPFPYKSPALDWISVSSDACAPADRYPSPSLPPIPQSSSDVRRIPSFSSISLSDSPYSPSRPRLAQPHHMRPGESSSPSSQSSPLTGDSNSLYSSSCPLMTLSIKSDRSHSAELSTTPTVQRHSSSPLSPTSSMPSSTGFASFPSSRSWPASLPADSDLSLSSSPFKSTENSFPSSGTLSSSSSNSKFEDALETREHLFPPQQTRKVINRPLCMTRGCTRKAQAGGNCRPHGGGSRCKVLDCNKFAQGGGLCKSHGGGKRCEVKGCSKGAQAGGKCGRHGGGRRCRSADCSKLSQKGGYCTRHYRESMAVKGDVPHLIGECMNRFNTEAANVLAAGSVVACTASSEETSTVPSRRTSSTEPCYYSFSAR